MLFARKPVVTGMFFPPTVRCFRRYVGIAPWLPSRRSLRLLTITFRTTPNIQSTAGGSYGDEFRPD
jgi:hypothetical protein